MKTTTTAESRTAQVLTMETPYEVAVAEAALLHAAGETLSRFIVFSRRADSLHEVADDASRDGRRTQSMSGYIWLRPLGWRDVVFAWRVAAEPSVRAMSFDPKKPTPLKHLRWMARQLEPGTGASAGVVMDAKERCGVVTVKQSQGRTWVGVAILPPFRGRGLTSMAIRMLTQITHEQARPLTVRVYAAIKKENAASLALFHKAGYGHDTMEDGHWTLCHPAR